MTVPYAALIGVAMDASRGIGDRISRAYRGGNPELDREKDRIQLAYLDAMARRHGAPTNYSGTMDAHPVNGGQGPIIGNQPGLGPALQSLMGGGDTATGGSAEDITKSDFFKHSGDYGAESAAELAGGGGGAGGGAGPSIIADSGIEDADWYKNAGRSPEALLNRRWHPDDERDPWRRL